MRLERVIGNVNGAWQDDGNAQFNYRNTSRTLNRSEVLHFEYSGSNSINDLDWCKSPIDSLLNAVTLWLNMHGFQLRMLDPNYVKQNILLTSTTPVVDKAKVTPDPKSDIKKNVIRPMIIGGITATNKLTQTANDVGYKDSMDNIRSEVSNTYGIPTAYLASSQTNALASGLAEHRKAFIAQAVMPIVNTILAPMNSRFLRPGQYLTVPAWSALSGDLDETSKVVSLLLGNAQKAATITPDRANQILGIPREWAQDAVEDQIEFLGKVKNNGEINNVPGLETEVSEDEQSEV